MSIFICRVGVLAGISLILASQVIFTAAAGVSIGAVIVTIFLLDIGQQTQQVVMFLFPPASV